VVICQCRRLSHRTVDRALRSGRRTLRDVCLSTGAGQVCGGCVDSVRERIERHFAALAPTTEWQSHEAA